MAPRCASPTSPPPTTSCSAHPAPAGNLGARSATSSLRSNAMRNFLRVVLLMLLATTIAHAQKPPAGIWEGYDGEWLHVSQQLLALAEATPAAKFSRRPAPGVRSTSEVFMHIVIANFYLLSVTRPKMPPEIK